MSKPNIFRYASRELSQDAFMGWLFSWVDYPEESELHLCAKSVLAQLCSMQSGLNLKADDMIALLAPKDHPEVSRPYVQYHDIDVYLRVLCKDGRTLSVIIENKTRTVPHDNQLARYRDIIRKQVPEDGDPVCLYFKTGYVFDFEKRNVESQGYAVLQANDILELLVQTGKAITHCVFRDFVDHLYRITEERAKVLREFQETGSLHLLNHDYCQYEFMKSLQSACDCEKWNVGMATTAPCQWYTVGAIHPGSDHGRPWTSLVFACFPSVYGENSEVLTYRLQIGGTDTSPTPELVLQQYAWWDGSRSDFERRKTERRDKLRLLFRKSNPIGGALPERVARNRGRYSSEIAVFSLNDTRACELLITHLPAIHRNFVQYVQGEMTP